MMRIVQTPPKSRLARFLEQVPEFVFRVLWLLGLMPPSPYTSETPESLVDLLVALKHKSEAALGMSIRRVSLAAPWLLAWKDHAPGEDHPIIEALVLAGLMPFTMDPEEPLYITEAQAVLAGSGFQLCAPFGSYGSGGQDEDEPKNRPVFFVSWTNDLVYTEIQSAQCFYNKPNADKIRGNMTTGQTFPDAEWLVGSPWLPVLKDITNRGFRDLKRYDEQTPGSAKEAIVLLAGEAGEMGQMPFAITRKVAKKLLHLFGRTSPEVSQRGVYDEIQFVWQDNATFAAASGAALWSRLRLEAEHYCAAPECGGGRRQPFSPLDGLEEESCASTPEPDVEEESEWLDMR